MPDNPTRSASIGLLLTGGGARAAYQVGVLEAIADMRRASGEDPKRNPFAVITGTSAGAINAAALACGADHFDHAVRRVARVWKHFHSAQVYRADTLSMLSTGVKWLGLLSLGWAIRRWRRTPPKSLLDNAPLKDLLHALVPLERLPGLIAQGHLHALAVTASSYSSGDHVTFFEGRPHLRPWERSQRFAVQDTITHQHLLASSAIPFVFPPVGLLMEGHTEYFGDGSMRQSAPISPAIHLGSEKILVIGAGRLQEPRGDPQDHISHDYPSLAQIAGHTLSNIFLDSLAVDVERARRINATLQLIPEEKRQHSALRPLELLVIAPTQRLDAIAAKHIGDLPKAVRSLLGGLGVEEDGNDVRSAALASYLLFETNYTRELMAMGYADTQNQSEAVRQFFGWPTPVCTAR